MGRSEACGEMGKATRGTPDQAGTRQPVASHSRVNKEQESHGKEALAKTSSLIHPLSVILVFAVLAIELFELRVWHTNHLT